MVAALEAEQVAALGAGGLGEPAGEALLNSRRLLRAMEDQPIARMRASSSSWLTGLTR